MIVAAITEVSTADDANLAHVLTALFTGAGVSLMLAVGRERHDQLNAHYRRVYQDSGYEICNARDVEEPEFDLHNIARSSDKLHMFLSERLAVDDFIKREAAAAPDVVVVVGSVIDQVEDWERQILSHCPLTDYPDALEVVTRVLQQAMMEGLRSVVRIEPHDGYPAALVVIAEGSSRWMHDTYQTKQITF